MTQTIRINAKKISIILTLIILLIIMVMSINTLMIKILYKKEYSEYVNKYSQEYGLDENLIYAVIKAESNFQSDAISNKNALGLMQLMPATAEEVANKNNIKLTEENILEPDVNINIGTKYISTLLEKYESVEVALAAYNAGIGNVDKWIENGIIKPDGSDIENIPFKETNNYVRKIMRDYKIYSES
ncbi:MAG: lytic transglycosylase domain-containing protein [Clostridia bacterium]|nr:lytic transglycosylase domain-containing protein [Clostridia bacterium]